VALLSASAGAVELATPQLRAATPQQVHQFRIEQNSHRLRVSATVAELLSNRAFLEANPEFDPLARQIENAVRGALLHDYSKASLPDHHPVIQALAGNRELDRRSLAADDPRKIQMDHNVRRLNQLDDRVWKLAESKVGNDPSTRKLLTNLVAAIDWHDTAVNRKSEFGGHNGRNLKRDWDIASDWIKKQSGIPESDRSTMLKVSGFLETKFDYQNKISRRYTALKVQQEGFNNLEKRLHEKARLLAGAKGTTRLERLERENVAPARASRALKHGLIRTPGAIGVAITAVQINSLLVQDPETITNSTLANAVRGILPGSKCDGAVCADFKKKCESLKKDEATCARDEFFARLPLHEQTRLREDPELNNLLLKHAPNVMSLSCTRAADRQEVRLSLLNGAKVVQNQTIEFNADAEPVRSSIAPENSDNQPTLVHFEGGKPQSLQYFDHPVDPETGRRHGKYQSLGPRNWVNRKLYPHAWLLFRNEYRAIQQAQETQRLLASQPRAITRCCHDTECTRYFNDVRLRAPGASAATTASSAR
jgi:hypothetical protein